MAKKGRQPKAPDPNAPQAPQVPTPGAPGVNGSVGSNKPLEVYTMPEEYRHGKVKMSKPAPARPAAPAKISPTPAPAAAPPLPPAQPTAPAQVPSPASGPPVPPPSNMKQAPKKRSAFRKTIIITVIVAVLLVLVVGGALGYSFYVSSTANANTNAVVVNTNTNIVVNTNTNTSANANAVVNANVNANVNVNVNTNVNTNTNTSTNTNITTDVSAYEARETVESSRDSDRDSLTDIEESLFHTEVGRIDTDGDGYVDGKEVLSGYDPLSTGDVEDSDYVEPYTNHKFGYTVYILEEWLAEPVDTDETQVLLTSYTGEFVEIIVEENTDALTASQWFLEENSDVDEEDLEPITRHGIQGVISPDKYTTYFATDDYIFVINYNFGIKDRIDFLTTYQMIVNSFRFDENDITEE